MVCIKLKLLGLTNRTSRRKLVIIILISLLLLFNYSLLFAVGKTDGGGVDAVFWITGGGFGGGGDGYGSQSNVGIAIAITLVAGLAVIVYSNRGHLQSPWSRRRRKHALQPKQWKHLFDEDGRLCDGGLIFLKKVRSGGVHPSIRAEVWPFLLGVYDLKSSKQERDALKTKHRKEYDKLRKLCQLTYKLRDKTTQIEETCENNNTDKDDGQVLDPSSCSNQSDDLKPCDGSEITSKSETESSDCDSSEEADDMQPEKLFQKTDFTFTITGSNTLNLYRSESYATWQRIIRLDAIRANGEWIPYSPSQASVDSTKAIELAESVCLKDYSHLEACRIFHAARLVSVLEAYALYDSEIGYCQGMSDLLSPIISVVEEDSEAFWCFVGFMKKARHNFRLDEVGIRRQLNLVSKIIKGKDSHLYRHLEEMQAEDCFFVYRMVVVLFRRELNFEQTLCLWEVMWADQTAIRAGITKPDGERVSVRAPPTDDLLLYAIAACVLQRRKEIIDKFSSMDEILRECNNLAGHLDVWKLLDDAHDLVVKLHDKI
ncbi:rab GTPase-activating protein 22-like [Bidens hawaiensis]|uniref:rab GTPase-activating protein 22-like n=1 Tax=Bidens hawaiensis TaxID=980011 RepID=UPI00404B39FF